VREARIAEDQTSALVSERDRLEHRVADARGGTDAGAGGLNERPNLRATLINRAEAPYAPMPERLWLWVLLAVLGALIAAMIIAWLIDQFDKPIYTPEDFESASGVPPVDRFARGAGA
jgi:hypothetical protein